MHQLRILGFEKQADKSSHGKSVLFGVRPAERFIHQHSASIGMSRCKRKNAGLSRAKLAKLDCWVNRRHIYPAILDSCRELRGTGQSGASQHLVTHCFRDYDP